MTETLHRHPQPELPADILAAQAVRAMARGVEEARRSGEGDSAASPALRPSAGLMPPAAPQGRRALVVGRLRGAARRVYRLPVLGYWLRAAALVARLPRVIDRIIAWDAARARADDALSRRLDLLEGRAAALEERAARMDTAAEALTEAVQPIPDLAARLEHKADAGELARAVAEVRRTLTQHRRLLEGRAAAADASSSPPPQAQATAAAPPPPATGEEASALEGFYMAFEDRFRGSRETIRERLSAHLPTIAAAVADTGGAPVLDIGCGRGEWLELLTAQGHDAAGIDISPVMVDECRDRGLRAELGDAVGSLVARPDDSLAAVTAIHVIEHLPLPVIRRMIEEALRTLRPGGVLLMETPNPENVQVGAHYFWLDLSHIKPLPSLAIGFLAEHCGFSDVRVQPLHPMPLAGRVFGDEALDHINHALHGPQDYCVIARK